MTTAFEDHEYEGYVQDAFKWKRNLTVTVGLRYSLFGVPYEINGTEVIPTTSLNQFFADRNYAAMAGISNANLATSLVSYSLGGPVNKGPGYYPTDKKDWAPRLAVAYSPEGERGSRESWVRVVCSAPAGHCLRPLRHCHGAVLRVQRIARARNLRRPTVNTNYTTAFRYTGNGYPTLPTVSGGSFPLTPAIITGGFTTFSGVSSTLKGALRIPAQRQLRPASSQEAEH